MNQSADTSFPRLIAAGVTSAVVTVALFSTTRGGLYESGLVFGAIFAAYFAVQERQRSPLKLSLFVATCAASLTASAIVASNAMMLLRVPGTSAANHLPLDGIMYAGGAGAFLVLAATVLLFGPGFIDGWSLFRVLLGSLAGALLAAIGGFIDRTLALPPGHLVAVFLVWQTGTALLIGLILQGERRWAGMPAPVGGNVPPPPARRLNLASSAVPPTAATRGSVGVAAAFFACVLGPMGFLAIRDLRANMGSGLQDTAVRRSRDDAPSLQNLPEIAASAIDKALIIRDIDGLHAADPTTSALPAGGSMPASMEYSVGYTTAAEPPPPPASFERTVQVIVTEYPNDDWSRYLTRYPLDYNLVIDSPGQLTSVTKFGQTITRDSIDRHANDTGLLCYRWPSGNFTIAVCYETPHVDEEFLRRYLEKYPSSL
jgi:hypothetical protein